MKLVKHIYINREYFKRGAPSKKEWRELVDSGVIGGKILDTAVFVDEDDFLSRDIFGTTAANEDGATIADRVSELLG